ncbi:hypothetical protein scyTo_0025110, partial [Scyliorhinus torazame]|nr:hypothetical protein [Scyliorhinus torazame]
GSSQNVGCLELQKTFDKVLHERLLYKGYYLIQTQGQKPIQRALPTSNI